MDQSTLAAYFAMLIAVTAVPGPLIAIVAARSLDRDSHGAAAFAAGVCIGDMIAIVAVAIGFGAWTAKQPQLLALIRYAGVAYLLWIAARTWLDSMKDELEGAMPQRRGIVLSAVAGVALCLGNPTTFLFHMLLLPSVAPAGLADMGRLVVVMLVALAAVGLVFAVAILLARRAKRLLASPASSARFSRFLSATIAATSLWLLAV